MVVWDNLSTHVSAAMAELTALVKTRLRRMQYRPGLLGGFLASTRAWQVEPSPDGGYHDEPVSPRRL